MFERFSVGQTVAIELVGNTLVGEIVLINNNKKRIKVRDPKNLKTNLEHSGDINFFASEILSIGLFESSENFIKLETNIDVEETEAKKNSTNSKICTVPDFDAINKVNWIIVNRLIYIKSTDKSYHNAIKDLSSQEKVSLRFDKCSMGRNSLSATVVTLYSPDTKNLYIFDMLCFGQKIYPEFQNIFIKPKPIKIVFDGRYINDCLFHGYNIELNGVFDNYIGHVVLMKKDKEIDFNECLMKYFHIPQNYFMEEEEINWNSRPLKADWINSAAKKTAFNYLLYEKILNEGLLKRFYSTCDDFSKLYSRNNDFASVAMKMSTGYPASLKPAIETDMKLSNFKDLSILKKLSK